jgi:hypothetical protein
VSSRNNLSSLLDDLVGAGEQRGRHFEAKSDSSSAAAGGIATGNGTGASKPESQPGLDQDRSHQAESEKSPGRAPKD